MKTALYARHSIKEAIQKTSMKSQIFEGESAALRNKLFIDERYLDPEVSARSKSRLQRPQLNRLLSDIQAGIVQNVIVSRRCRLARNLSEHLEIYDIFWKYQINVIFSEGGEPPMIYSEEGEILEAIFGAKNEIEGNKIADGLKAGRRAKANEGRKPGGPTPYGYRTIETKDKTEIGKMKKDEAEAGVVLRLFNIFLDQDFKSFAEYVRYLKAQNVVPLEWDDSRIRGMFKNQYYGGYLNHKGNLTPVPHLRIFEDEYTWGLIQEKLIQKYSTGRKNTKHDVVFLLKGKINCTLCNETMTTRRYTYMDVEGFYECEKHGVKIKKNVIERGYLQAAKEYLLAELPSEMEKMYPAYVLKKTTDLENKLFDLEFDLHNIGDSLIDCTQLYMLESSKTRKEELTNLKQEYNLKQECISSIKGEIGRFKGMVKFSATTHLKAAEFELQTRLSKFKDDDLVQFLISLCTSVVANSNDIIINWANE